jgi:hypothetical protein
MQYPSGLLTETAARGLVHILNSAAITDIPKLPGYVYTMLAVGILQYTDVKGSTITPHFSVLWQPNRQLR